MWKLKISRAGKNAFCSLKLILCSFLLPYYPRLLHVAALWDNAELLEDLLNGEELRCLDATDSLGRTALHAAATNASSKCLRIMVQAGAKVDAVCGPKGEGR